MKKMSLAVLSALAVSVVAFPQQAPYDVVIHDGMIVDGTGNPWYRADIGITGGRIQKIGTIPPSAGRKAINASGRAVSPGFIDLHTHSDIPVLVDGTAQSAVRQGVTLDVIGESASIEKPKQYPAGIEHVLVNGIVVVENGNHTGAKPGKAVLGAGFRQTPNGAAAAADLVILTNQGATPGVRELAAAFSRASGHHVTVIQADDAVLQQKLSDGTADLITGNPSPVDELVKSGKVVAGTVTPFVRAGLGLSVRAGAPKPDISTVEAYKAALLSARSIGYSRGCSGTNIGEGIEQLGLTAQLKNKTIFTTAGPVTDYLARGDFEIGIQQTNIMVGVPGTDYVGPLPGFLNKPCLSSVGLSTNSKQPEAARAMIRFMISPEAAPLLRKTYVEPFRP